MNEVKESKYYCILFDETTDVSHVSQMCLILRYINKGVIQENFISFIDCHTYVYKQNKSFDSIEDTIQDCNDYEPKLTGEILGNTVVKF